MTLEEFKLKEKLSEDEFELYVERTGIMHFDGKREMPDAHKFAMNLIREGRREQNK